MSTRSEKFAEMDTLHLECRTWAHAWVHKHTLVQTLDRSKVYVQVLWCDRCSGTRTDVYLARDASLVSRTYGYPDRYLVGDLRSWGGRSLFNANVRHTLLRRLAEE